MDSAGSKSAMSNDVQEITEGKEDITNRIRGHKANLSNPNTSEESKQASREALRELGGDETLEDRRNNPVSKDAAEKLYGSRAAAG
ncbi:hypothetical protein B0I37DRAFT_444533 [Chaetomium sp. MPI-CAGE-AT-0009]|nr:hypothetical protein B0I37DRAFT_444533 [Chaetomium sp. MPI-CAGE-AT-0009]